MFDLERIRTTLDGASIGHLIDYHTSVSSTMPVAHEWARQPGTRSGMVVIAEEQTAGRGRQRRPWAAPPGRALLMSVLLKAPLHFSPTHLPMAAGIAVVRALTSTLPALSGHVGLKWPNDVLLGDNRANAGKVAGILIENEWGAGALNHAVVGIGLNVNQTLAELPAPQPGAPPPTSLRTFLQAEAAVDRGALFVALCRQLAATLTLAGSAEMWAEWRAALWTLGQSVAILEEGRMVCQGRAVDVTSDGSLVVVDDGGVRRLFSAGDVSVRAP